MRGDYYYRGTSLTDAADRELGTGRLDGATFTMYKGEIREPDRSKTIPRGTPVADLPWWTPEGHPEDDAGHRTETVAVTGGLTHTLGTAIGFATGLPLVFYYDRSALGRSMAVSYDEAFFEDVPGALAWVTGAGTTGEIRSFQGDLYGLTRAPSEPSVDAAVDEWFGTGLRTRARRHRDEREVLVRESSIDVAQACEAIAIVTEGGIDPQTVLAQQDGYHAGFGDADATDIARWSDEEILAELAQMVRDAAQGKSPTVYGIGLDTRMMEKFPGVPDDDIAWVYDGDRVSDDPNAVPGFLLGDQEAVR